MTSLRSMRLAVVTAVAISTVPLLGLAPAAAQPAGPPAGPAPATTTVCSQAYLPLPDPACTPGVTYSAVSQATINSTICVSGWTSTVRPPTSYTNPLKVQQIAQYGYSDTSTADYEEDHYIPLELGGNPTDPHNLWPEPRYAVNGSTAAGKDSVENKLKTMVCAGQTTLAVAQAAIVHDFRTAIAVVSGTGGASVSVTSPGARSSVVGSSVSLQIQATDTAGGSLTYSTTGLPTGLTISATTGLITGTATSAGTFTVTVTARDSGGVAGSTTFTWTVTAGGGCPAGQLVANPGFESGATTWTSTSGVVTSSSAEPAHSGSWKAWLDGYGVPTTDTLTQTVTLPAGCTTVSFTFWMHIDTAETTSSTAYDTLKFQLLNASGGVLANLYSYSNLNANTGYSKHTFNLAAYAGSTITLSFTGAEDGQAQTSFVIDDTALTVS